ncbi:MAG: LacI family DNA-binding transcriptional regulator [Clostridium sp.]|uniref:LacI family DNA-binding transcriptional regulator n=1 Tax=Clostridium sp. TaxID=1506 RepID=UPI00290FD7FF|nr:LacI family DNA-binding transcriptional regulator [Clostridium sp.]MDU7337810.1 LacI family DNA-binding transcriptional regulator [Clostridium sp.]
MNIYDIAQRSGVSIATVSRVMNGSPNVSAATREKVMAVIQEEEYIPNAFARGLNLNSMKIIGILCTDIADTFYAKAVSLVESLLRQNGFDALLCCTGNDLEDKKKYLELLLAKRVDAVILIGSAFKENVDNSHIEMAAKQVPVIIINGLVELPGTYCVTCDEQTAVAQNVTLLNRQGYSEILYLYDILTYSGCSKLSGYRDGLKQCGIPVNESLIVQVPKSIEQVKRRVLTLFDSGISFRAVMASEDLLAIGAIKALQKLNLTMPVIGFNNSILSESCSPSLTSVDNMLDTLCPAAISMLTGILEGKSVPQKMVISATLVQRDTFQATPQ